MIVELASHFLLEKLINGGVLQQNLKLLKDSRRTQIVVFIMVSRIEKYTANLSGTGPKAPFVECPAPHLSKEFAQNMAQLPLLSSREPLGHLARIVEPDFLDRRQRVDRVVNVLRKLLGIIFPKPSENRPQGSHINRVRSDVTTDDPLGDGRSVDGK